MKRKPVGHSKKPYFSIVIPTLNEEKALPALLTDLSRQTFFSDELEVIHVDAHSDDRTQEIAALFSERLHLTLLNSKDRNVSIQRNLGAARASGKYIIFMDADNRLPQYFLDCLKYQLVRHGQTDVFSITPIPHVRSVSARDRLIYELIALLMKATKKINQPHALGAMLGIRSTAFKKVKFRPEFRVSEDSEFVREALKKGCRYELFDEPPFMISLRRLDRDGFFKQAKIHISIWLRFFDKNAATRSDFGYDMAGGASYEVAQIGERERHSSSDPWTNAWQQVSKSLQAASPARLLSTHERLLWLTKLRKYAASLNISKR